MNCNVPLLVLRRIGSLDCLIEHVDNIRLLLLRQDGYLTERIESAPNLVLGQPSLPGLLMLCDREREELCRFQGQRQRIALQLVVEHFPPLLVAVSRRVIFEFENVLLHLLFPGCFCFV